MEFSLTLERVKVCVYLHVKASFCRYKECLLTCNESKFLLSHHHGVVGVAMVCIEDLPGQATSRIPKGVTSRRYPFPFSVLVYVEESS